MLSYQHGYHAGNLADLHKHIVLTALWSMLKRKPRPLSYMESHAGRGIYHSSDAFALKTGEWREGLGAYQGGNLVFDSVLAKVKSQYGADAIPGSSAIIAAMATAEDRLILAELHPQEYAALKTNFSVRPEIHPPEIHPPEIHHRDGYEMLAAMAPPKPRRGLVLIDPSYEMKSEYADMPKNVGRFLSKWPEAVVIIWYPILDEAYHLAIEKTLTPQGSIISRAYFPKSSKLRMYGSGMLILNAPYGAREYINEALDPAAKIFHRIRMKSKI